MSYVSNTDALIMHTLFKVSRNSYVYQDDNTFNFFFHEEMDSIASNKRGMFATKSKVSHTIVVD